MRTRAQTTVLMIIALVAVAAMIALVLSRPRRTDGLKLPGVVEVQEVRLGSKLGGRVAETLVREGDVVDAGQVLVRVDMPEQEAQRDLARAEVAAARASLEKARNGPRPEEIAAARAAVEAARARWKRIKIGPRDEEIRRARGDQEAAEADLLLAATDLDRIDRLFRRGTAARSEYDAAQAAHDRAKGRASAARAHLEMLQVGSRPEEIEEAAAELARAQADLDLKLAGTRAEEVAAAEAVLAEAQARLLEKEANLREAQIRSPDRAVVDVLAVRVGDLLAPGATAVRILRADDLWVRVYVPETQLGRVRVGQAVRVTVDSHPGVAFEGRVIQIGSISEFTPRNVQSPDQRRFQVFGAKVRVENPRGVFKSGMAAEVEIPLAVGSP